MEFFPRYNARVWEAGDLASRNSAVAWLRATSPLPPAETYLALEGLDREEHAATLRAIREQGGDAASGAAADRLVLAATAIALRRAAERLQAGRARAIGLAVAAALAHYQATRTQRQPTLVMGILNVTPDSFSDGGRFAEPAAAIARAEVMAAEGADVIDIGGESTRPGAEEVPVEEELRRVLPVVEALAERAGLRLSIDTRKAAVARACLAAGAWMINDVSAGTHDPAMLGTVAQAGAQIALMHMRGTPATMQQRPEYDDVVADTGRYLRERCAAAVEAGIPPENLWIDPGFGFGKTVEHNLAIVRRLREYTSIGPPVLLGPSRKSTLGHVLEATLGPTPPGERLEATAAAVTAAILRGARMVRVHDVREMVRVARMADALRDAG